MEKSQIMNIMSLLDVLVILFALLAAVYWFLSSRQKIPQTISIGWGGEGGTAQQLGDALKEIGRLSTKAAFFAFLAAIFQALSLLCNIFI